ncbi:hypothetical protein LSAT2_001201 [Lamellibrachia satsuma]|nr:hypothetical protein LSAT2_001201 [Lamellibrachia satsuma]
MLQNRQIKILFLPRSTTDTVKVLLTSCIRRGKTFKSNSKRQRQAHHTTQQQCSVGLRIQLSKDATELGGLSVGCDACLDWFHGRYMGIITAPKNNLDV